MAAIDPILDRSMFTVISKPSTEDSKSATVEVMASPQTLRWVVAAEKGGAGKTTLAASLAGGLAEGSTKNRRSPARRVLAIDLDPQGALTAALGTSEHAPTIYDVLMGKATARTAIRPSLTPGLDVLPAGIDLSGAAVELPRHANWQTSLGAVLDELDSTYQDIVIDTPPGLGVLTMVGLVAARHVLVPVLPAFSSIRLVDQFLATVERARKFTPQLTVLGLVPWMVSRRTLHRDEALAEMVKRWPDLVLTRTSTGAPTGIPDRVAFQDAAVQGLPITAYDPTSPPAIAVRGLIQEILTRAPST
jgi:chromosome partitioning protein